MSRPFEKRTSYDTEVTQIRALIRLFKDGEAHDDNVLDDGDRETIVDGLRMALEKLATPVAQLPIEERALRPLKAKS